MVTGFATVLTLAVLFSPLSWKGYCLLLIPAYFVLWRIAFMPMDAELGADAIPRHARRRIAWMLATSFALMTLTVRGVVGKDLGVKFEALSSITLGMLIVLAALLYARSFIGRAEAPALEKSCLSSGSEQLSAT